MPKRLLKIILIAGLTVSLTGLVGCSLFGSQDETSDQDQQQQQEETSQEEPEQVDQTSETQGENLLTIDPGTVAPELKESLEFAQRKAEGWQSNAKLTAVQVEIPASLKKEFASLRYVYSSPASPYYYWTIAISSDNQNYVRALIPKEDYISMDLRVVLSQYWKLNYVEALQLADQNGGETWRKENKLGKIKMTLNHGQPSGYLYWNIEYSAINDQGQRTPEKDLKIKINAYTGEITE